MFSLRVTIAQAIRPGAVHSRRCLQQRSQGVLSASVLQSKLSALHTYSKSGNPRFQATSNLQAACSSNTRPDLKTCFELRLQAACSGSTRASSSFGSQFAPEDAKRELLFIHEQPWKYRLLGAGSIAHICYWAWYNSLAEAVEGFQVNLVLSNLGLGISVILLLLARTFADKTVSKLYYIEPLMSLEIERNNLWGGRTAPRLVPLKDIESHTVVSAASTVDRGQYFAIKVKNDYMFTLIDQTSGTFVDKDRLQQLVESKGIFPAPEQPKTVGYRHRDKRRHSSSEAGSRGSSDRDQQPQ
eukprot:20870-Heterococcus_DN1.PRE.3